MINIKEIIAATRKWEPGLTKINSPISINSEPYCFVPNAIDRIYSTDDYPLPFKINGISYKVARKGYRPGFNKRYSGSFPDKDKYIIRFNDGEVRLCDTICDINLDVSLRRGDIISSSKENVHFIYLLLQGAGGGGSGSSMGLGAGGGASGALLVVCICIDSIWTLKCGAKGLGGGGSTNGARGGDTLAINSNLTLNAPGGNGGEYDGKKSYGNLPISQESDKCHCILSVQGISGGAPNGSGDKFSACNAENYGLIGESILSFAQVPSADVGYGLHGGGGGSSAFGTGGFGSNYLNEGTPGNGYGAGGGGAGQGMPKRGGDGCDGCIEIFV